MVPAHARYAELQRCAALAATTKTVIDSHAIAAKRQTSSVFSRNTVEGESRAPNFPKLLKPGEHQKRRPKPWRPLLDLPHHRQLAHRHGHSTLSQK